jgi:uncharacterized protein YaiI (UPF0178 family)
MVIYVDGDACPVKAEAERVATRHGLELYLVSNGGLRPSANPLVKMIYVTEGPDEADKWIAERAGPADVVVTNDIPLAARCVEAGARVVKANGEALTPANIGPVLATRDLMTDQRAADPFIARRVGPWGRFPNGRSRTCETLSRFRRDDPVLAR